MTSEFNIFSKQKDLYNDLQKRKDTFNQKLDRMIDDFSKTIDMEYFLGVEFQRDVTFEFIHNLKSSCENSTITKVSDNSTIKQDDTLVNMLNETSKFSEEIKQSIDEKYKNENISMLKNINNVFKKYNESKDITVLSPLYTNYIKQSGGNVNVSNIVNTKLNFSTHAINSQKQLIGNNPFINMSNTIFDSNNVSTELIENYDKYSNEVLSICNTYIQAVYMKQTTIEQYIDDVFVNDVGSIFYLMTQLTYYKENLVSQVGGKRKKRIQYGGGKISDFLKKTVSNYDELPLSKKLFYVEHISVELMGYLLNKFLVFVGLFEIDITKISNPYEFLMEIQSFINNILYDKLIQCISKSEEYNKKLTDVIQETKSWIKVTLNIHRILGLISFILSYVPEQSQYIETVSKLTTTINNEKEMLGAVKQTLITKSKYLQEVLSKNGDMLLTDMIDNEDIKNILTMSVFKKTNIEDINYDIKCILSQSFENITIVFETYADALKEVQFDNSAKLKILTIFQKIGHSYNSRVVRQLFTGLTKGLTKMHKFIDKAQSRIVSKLLVGTQAVFLNSMFMYGPLMINGLLLVLWGCTKGCMFIHKLKKQRQMVTPVSDEIWQRMLIEENDKANLIDKIKKLVGDNSELLSKLDIEDSIKNIPEYIENNVHKSFINDVQNHDFSVVVDNYMEEKEEINETLLELINELPEDISNSTANNFSDRKNKCNDFAKETSITIRVPSVINDKIRNEIEDIYKDEMIKRHFSTTDNDIASIITTSHTRKIASAWFKKTNKINIDNNIEEDSVVNGETFIQSLQRKPSVCTPTLSTLLRNRSASITSKSFISNVRQPSIISMRQPSVDVRRSSVSMLKNQTEGDDIAKLSELTLRSVVKFKKLGQLGGRRKVYTKRQKHDMTLFLNKYSRKELEQYAVNKNISIANLPTKKDIVCQIIRYRAIRKI